MSWRDVLKRRCRFRLIHSDWRKVGMADEPYSKRESCAREQRAAVLINECRGQCGSSTESSSLGRAVMAFATSRV